jgi:hypothetical protein
MGRAALFAGVVFVLVLAVAKTSRSDVAIETTSPVDDTAGLPSGAPEPTLGTPVVNAPGDETVQKDPFAPFSAEGGVPYEELDADEKAAIDRNRDTTGWQKQNDAFAQAVRERSKKARAEAAQHQLGLEALDQIGVVP